MKRLAALLPLLLVGCTSAPHGEDFSFHLTMEVVESSLEKEYENDPPVFICYGSGQIAYKLDLQPKDFTGSIYFKGQEKIGNWVDNKWHSYLFHVINGQMVPLRFDLNSYYGNAVDFEPDKRAQAICDMNKADDYSVFVDYSSVVMTPGFQPSE